MDETFIEMMNRKYLQSLGLQGDFDATAYMNPAGVMTDDFLRSQGMSGGHWKDKGKLPWHPSFSNQSTYSTEAYTGGIWESSYNSEGVANDTFTPSIDMIPDIDINRLRQYFIGFTDGNNLNEINMY